MDSRAPVFGPPSSFSAPLGRVPTDEERSRDLTRIKIIATTLLVFSVVVAFAARLLETRHWSLGYVATISHRSRRTAAICAKPPFVMARQTSLHHRSNQTRNRHGWRCPAERTLRFFTSAATAKEAVD